MEKLLLEGRAVNAFLTQEKAYKGWLFQDSSRPYFFTSSSADGPRSSTTPDGSYAVFTLPIPSGFTATVVHPLPSGASAPVRHASK